jgi:HEAT repeat protein
VSIFFCPGCWDEVSEAARSCPTCGADLEAFDRASFQEKLLRALWHPEPLTARRAAELLGRLAASPAVPKLLARYRSEVDPFFAAEIARALIEIGGEEARAALAVIPRDPSIIVRRAAGGEWP